MEAFIEKVTELNVDVVNFSWGDHVNQCSLNHGSHDNIDTAYFDDIFWGQIAGNEGHLADTTPPQECTPPYTPSGCTVRSDAVASGAFTVGSIKKTGDLDTAKISCADWDSGSSRGGDGRGRPLLKIVAPCGREGTNNARLGCVGINCYHVYGDGSCGTSTACPMVVGAAANLEDFLLTHYPLGTADDAGLIYAIMLLMGDGTTESGVQAETTPIDELWGVGRMRMRLFTEAGMDAPWRWGFKIAELDHGETMVQPINVVRPTGNQPVPSQARWFRAAPWFYEPSIALPYYWEDRDRDDPDGPGSGIE